MTRDETIQGRHGLQWGKAGVGKHLTHSIRLQKPMQLFSEEDLYLLSLWEKLYLVHMFLSYLNLVIDFDSNFKNMVLRFCLNFI
jgi:hypothetical protein